MLLTLVGISNISSQSISTCCFFDSYWSKWEPEPTTKVKGDYDGFIVYDDADGPWDYYFKFTIDSFTPTSKKQRQKDAKEKKTVWYEYQGTVEYYVPLGENLRPYTAYDLFKYAKKATFWPKERKNETDPPVKKVISKARVKIETYKKFPTCYNIYFDNVGFAISLPNKQFSTTTQFDFDK